jgi:hypothetical protein
MTVETTNKGGAPEGNKNAAKGKLFYDKLRMVLIQDNQLKLRQIAEKLIEAAVEGEPWAVKEIMDRTDGKPHQSTTLENSDGSPLLQAIEVRFVKPSE